MTLRLARGSFLSRHKRLLLFLAFLAYLYFRGIGDHGLLDPLEGFNASVAVDMFTTGRYFHPHVGEQFAASRTLGTEWLLGFSMTLLGWNEFAVRFLPTLSGLLMVLAAALALPRRGGRWLAAALAASAPLTFTVSHLASPHALYAACMGLALVGFLRGEGRWGLLTGLAPLAGLVLYGPEGVLLPWVAFLLFVGLTDRFDALWPQLYSLAVSILGTVGYLVLLRLKNPALLSLLRCELPRLLPSGLGATLIALVGGVLPWLGLMGSSLWDALPRSRAALKIADERLLMLLWALTFCVGALSTGEPLALAACVPPLAALTGDTLTRWWERGDRDALLRAVAPNILILALAAGVGVPLSVRSFPLLREAGLSLGPWGIFLGLLALVSWHYARTRQFLKLARNASILALLCLLPLDGALDLAAGTSLRHVGPALRDLMNKEDVAVQYMVHCPSFYFYTLRGYALVDGPLIPGLDSRRLLMDDTALHLLWEGEDRAFLLIPQNRQPRTPLPQDVYNLMEEDGMVLLGNDPDKRP